RRTVSARKVPLCGAPFGIAFRTNRIREASHDQDEGVSRLNEMDRQALAAVFSIDYHLALLRAKAGHEGYASWGAAGQRFPRALGDLRPLSLRRAIGLITVLRVD